MKIIAAILCAAALLFSAPAHAVAEGDYIIEQIGSDGFSKIPRVLSQPAGSADGIYFFNGSTKVSSFVTIGSGLSVGGGALSASAAAFNFSLPSARTLAVSTDYQATDPTKAAVIYPSYACTNATTVLASSACTLQVRMGSSALNCSTGTIYYTQSLTVSLGVLLTQASTNPVPILLPIGAHFIICATAGTFTISTVEQSAG